jgi:hypothetical protein
VCVSVSAPVLCDESKAPGRPPESDNVPPASDDSKPIDLKAHSSAATLSTMTLVPEVDDVVEFVELEGVVGHSCHPCGEGGGNGDEEFLFNLCDDCFPAVLANARMCYGQFIDDELQKFLDLGSAHRSASGKTRQRIRKKADLQREYIIELMSSCGGSDAPS